MSAVRHVGITVTNLNESIRFYRDLLGFEIKKVMLESGECIDNFSNLQNTLVITIKMSAAPGSGTIELLNYVSHPSFTEDRSTYPITDVGCSHFAITVENLDSLYETLKQEGIKFNYPVQTSPDGNVKIAFCRDPDGTLIELVEDL